MVSATTAGVSPLDLLIELPLSFPHITRGTSRVHLQLDLSFSICFAILFIHNQYNLLTSVDFIDRLPIATSFVQSLASLHQYLNLQERYP